MDEFQYRAVENGVRDNLGSLGMSAQGARDMANALHCAFASGLLQESETVTRRNGDQFPRNNFAEFFLNDPDNRELLPSMGVVLDGLVGAMNDSIEQEIISPATEATSPLAAGEHAPINGEPTQETRVPNTYGSPPNSEPMYEVVSFSSIMERLNELMGRQGSVQIDSERAPNRSLLEPGQVTRDVVEQSGPPHRNQFTAHGYTEESILDQTNKPVLFWNGPRHQQFYVMGNLTSRLFVTEERTMPLRHEERTRGMRYSYILRPFRCNNIQFSVYVLEDSVADSRAVVNFFQSLVDVLNTYAFMAGASTFDFEQLASIQSLADMRRSIRQEVYQEVLEQVQREVAERERRQSPAAPQPEPTILPTIDTDQGRSIVL